MARGGRLICICGSFDGVFKVGEGPEAETGDPPSSLPVKKGAVGVFTHRLDRMSMLLLT